MVAGVVRILMGLAVATALLTGVGSTTGTSPAAAVQTYPERGQTSLDVLELQSRLVTAGAMQKKQIAGHYDKNTRTSVQVFQAVALLPVTGKVDAVTWTALVSRTGSFDTSSVPGFSPRCKTSKRVLCLDKTRHKLFYVKDSKIVQVMDARFGCSRTHTREGTFRVYRKTRHHVSSIYHTKMPHAMFFSRGEAVHYSSDYARGKGTCSHGCANIRDKKGLAWLYKRVRVGDRVVVYRN